MLLDLIMVAGGLTLLLAGAWLVVRSAVEIALAFDRFRPGRQAIGAVRGIAAATPAELREGVSVRLTGRPALRHDELQSVRAGMELAGALSFTLVVLLLLLCFRSIRLSIAALLTLVIGLVWTAAFAAAWNSSTMARAASS